MARHMNRNIPVRCRTGEKVEETETEALPIVIKVRQIKGTPNKRYAK